MAVHKSVFFKTAWARYDTARPGTLRLTPSDKTVRELRQDYLGMQPMFFRTPTPFEEILSSLPEMEAQINSASR